MTKSPRRGRGLLISHWIQQVDQGISFHHGGFMHDSSRTYSSTHLTAQEGTELRARLKTPGTRGTGGWTCRHTNFIGPTADSQNLGCLCIYVETRSLPHVPIPPNYRSSKMWLRISFRSQILFIAKLPCLKSTLSIEIKHRKNALMSVRKVNKL